MSGIPENEPESAPAAEQPTVAAAPLLPPENLVRGLLLSLIVLPVGVTVFVLVWNVGFVTSIIGFGVALAVFFLYRVGSGGRVSMPGAVAVTAVTVVTLVLAFLVAVASDVSHITHSTIPEALFGPYLAPAIASNGFLVLVTIGFGILGCFTVLRNAFREARAQAGPPTLPPAA